MKKDHVYFVYKVEIKEGQEIVSLFGYTDNRIMLDMFMKMRNKDRYYYRKYYKKEFDEICEQERRDPKEVIDKCKLDIMSVESVKLNRDMAIITTEDEKVSIENKILQRLIDLASFEKCRNPEDCIVVFQHLKDEFCEAMNYIGFAPKEFRLMDSELTRYNMEYDEEELYYSAIDVPVFGKGFIYSFEAYIGELRGEMR